MKKKFNILGILLVVVALGLIGFGGYNIYSIYNEKNEAEKRSEEIIREFEEALKNQGSIEELTIEAPEDGTAATGGAQDFSIGGRVVGVMTIEKMGLHWPIAMGVSDNTLYQYIGMYETHGTIGEKGQNAGFAAHACRDGLCAVASFDSMEDKLVKGDIIEILWHDGHTYRYMVNEVLAYQDPYGDFFEIEPDKELITLVTCTDGNSDYRTVVHASRIYDES